ncbi:MAG: type VI secretion system-associated protein TagF [Steroidobacteraceae bacterium]
MPATSETGFYGKLPCRGDFMQRRAPQEFVDAWDGWLQECLHVSRQQLGERWLDLYLTSPVWRFVLSEGICGESAYAGVMLPSVDRVGRYFPLTLVSLLEPGTCMLEAACGTGRTWFDAAEELALRALDASDLDLQAFDTAVDALAGLGACAALGQSSQLMELIARAGFAQRGSPWHLSMLGETPQRAANAFASLELQKAFRPCALWWTQGCDAVQPGWLATSGLPTPSGYVAMLSGQWQAAGWNSVEFAAAASMETATTSEATAPETPRSFDLQMIAARPPQRSGMSTSVAIRYITRPETGLWGIVVAADGGDPDARADLLADVAQDLPPQATLTTRIESARRALSRVLAPRAAAPGGAAAQRQGTLAVILFLADRTECALLWSGAVQAVRVRGGEAVEVLRGEARIEADAALGVSPLQLLDRDSAAAGDGGLLALLATPATPEPTLSVHYEKLEANDLWAVGADGAFADALIARLVNTWPGAAAVTEEACRLLDSTLAQHVPTSGAAEPLPALLLIAAQAAEPTPG